MEQREDERQGRGGAGRGGGKLAHPLPSASGLPSCLLPPFPSARSPPRLNPRSSPPRLAPPLPRPLSLSRGSPRKLPGAGAEGRRPARARARRAGSGGGRRRRALPPRAGLPTRSTRGDPSPASRGATEARGKWPARRGQVAAGSKRPAPRRGARRHVLRAPRGEGSGGRGREAGGVPCEAGWPQGPAESVPARGPPGSGAAVAPR